MEKGERRSQLFVSRANYIVKSWQNTLMSMNFRVIFENLGHGFCKIWSGQCHEI